MTSRRRERKDEHIENYLKTSGYSDPLFEDVYLDHNSLSDVNFDEIDTSIEFLGRKISMPIMINACLLYTSPSPRDGLLSRMPSSA